MSTCTSRYFSKIDHCEVVIQDKLRMFVNYRVCLKEKILKQIPSHLSKNITHFGFSDNDELW